jgi:hypothetical protein
MARKIHPSVISAQVDFDIGAAIDFCSDLLEDVNAHNVSYVLAAINAGAYDLAKEFIELERDQEEAGELTKDLRERREDLLNKLDSFDVEEEEEHEHDEDCRRHGCHRK